MAEKRFSVKKSGSGLFYRDGDYEIDNTIQFIIETVEMKLNQLSDENEELKKENYELHKRLGDFEQFEEHIKERTSKTFVKKCVYFNSVFGKKIDIPPYYEFEQRYDYVMHRKEYDGYD